MGNESDIAVLELRTKLIYAFINWYSFSMISPTPSYISLTAWYSVNPMRLLFETSTIPPSAAECSPRVPLTCEMKMKFYECETLIVWARFEIGALRRMLSTCKLCLLDMSFRISSFSRSLGIRISTDARMVVPKLVGQNVRNPSLESCSNCILFWISFKPRNNLL